MNEIYYYLEFSGIERPAFVKDYGKILFQDVHRLRVCCAVKRDACKRHQDSEKWSK